MCHCSSDFSVGRFELQKDLWQRQMGQGWSCKTTQDVVGTSSGPSWRSGQACAAWGCHSPADSPCQECAAGEMYSWSNLKPYSLENWVGGGSSGRTMTLVLGWGCVTGMPSGCLDTERPGPEWWPCMLCGWAGRSSRQEREILGEGTSSRLGFISWYVLLMSPPPPLHSKLEGWLWANGFSFQHPGA